MPLPDRDIAPYFSGQLLYGDDFTAAEITQWYADESEGYAGLGDRSGETYEHYTYHAMNKRHMFRHLPAGTLGNALGIGAAYGSEFIPVLDRLESVTILEPSPELRSDHLNGFPLSYVSPRPNGDMPFVDASFDLVTSFGTLHHIPNVSHVVAEAGRVTRPGGYLLVREPVLSMGDWRKPRHGLTKRERGIPRKVMLDILDRAGFDTVRVTWCASPVLNRIVRPGDNWGVLIDEAVSRALAWNYRYHAVAKWQKLRPASIAVVARRRRDS